MVVDASAALFILAGGNHGLPFTGETPPAPKGHKHPLSARMLTLQRLTARGLPLAGRAESLPLQRLYESGLPLAGNERITRITESPTPPSRGHPHQPESRQQHRPRIRLGDGGDIAGANSKRVETIGRIAAVLVAETYALMLAGLGLIGWRARRRG